MKKKEKINFYYLVFMLLILSMMVFPMFSIGNKVEPFIIGMPFSIIWVLFWIIVQFIGLLVFVTFDKED